MLKLFKRYEILSLSINNNVNFIWFSEVISDKKNKKSSLTRTKIKSHKFSNIDAKAFDSVIQ